MGDAASGAGRSDAGASAVFEASALATSDASADAAMVVIAIGGASTRASGSAAASELPAAVAGASETDAGRPSAGAGDAGTSNVDNTTWTPFRRRTTRLLARKLSKRVPTGSRRTSRRTSPTAPERARSRKRPRAGVAAGNASEEAGAKPSIASAELDAQSAAPTTGDQTMTGWPESTTSRAASEPTIRSRSEREVSEAITHPRSRDARKALARQVLASRQETRPAAANGRIPNKV